MLSRCRLACTLHGPEFSYELPNRGGHKVEHRESQSWVHAHPKHVVHDKVGVPQITDHAVFCFPIRRLSHKITAKEKSGRDFACFETANQIRTIKRSIVTNPNWKAEPGRVGMKR